jgi:Zn-dependent M16 (insulinase) family peptidase
MVLETKSGLEGGVIGGGHSVAASRLDAQRSVAGWVSEQMGGLSYLFYIRDLVSLSVSLMQSQNPLSFIVSLQLTQSLSQSLCSSTQSLIFVTPICLDMCFTVSRDSPVYAGQESVL